MCVCVCVCVQARIIIMDEATAAVDVETGTTANEYRGIGGYIYDLSLPFMKHTLHEYVSDYYLLPSMFIVIYIYIYIYIFCFLILR